MASQRRTGGQMASLHDVISGLYAARLDDCGHAAGPDRRLDEPRHAHRSWASATFGNAELHLFLKEDHDPATTAAAADLKVGDADALERRWSATGVGGTSDPYDTDYGMREAVHVDLDNNLIRFGSPLSSNCEQGRATSTPR